MFPATCLAEINPLQTLTDFHQLSHIPLAVLGARDNCIPCIFPALLEAWLHAVIYVTIISTNKEEPNVSNKKRKRELSTGACT